ncbi:extended synaptotagmin-3 [Scleropages formosus]|uniref:Extended synaptotagmin-3 n=1 Tax=Scleropages formosus TaxID=113540 RepID=A0A8C9RE89_SCLFO|nr:extended synaptotagmin-3-like [Scleropages formosus]
MSSMASSPANPGTAQPATGPPKADSKKEFNATAVNHILMEFVLHCGRLLLILYPVYLTGYLGLSISWVLLCVMIWTWWGKNQKHKNIRMDVAVDFLENEKCVISKEMKTLNMPAWVNFPEVEKVEWLNKILLQAWPFFAMFMEKLLKEKIQSAIRASNPALKTFSFTKVHFGQRPLRVTGVKAYTDEVDKREVVLDLNLSYMGDVDIDADVKKPITAGVKSLQLQGMLRVILEPLIGQSPLVGGITMFFIRRPTLEIDWTGVTNLLDTPALSQMTESAITDVIASLMVLPNRMCIPLIDQVKVDQMRFPLPRGIVRVRLVEAQDLVPMDTYMMGLMKGKSDPYAILRVGTIQFRSKTIKETLDPCWNEVYEFMIHEAPGQELEVELFDEDTTDTDDFLGRFCLDFGEVKKERVLDKWFTLEGVKHGKVHLNLQWLSLQKDPKLLVETSDGCSCAMLSVYIDSAFNLPKNQSEFSHNEKHGKTTKEAKLTRKNVNPDTYVEFSVNKQSQKSKVIFASKDPVWEECFTFFVHNLSHSLNVQVKQNEKKTLLGTLSLPLSRILSASDMTLDQRFQLEQSGANSQIKMKTTLRILKPEMPELKSTSASPSSQPRKTPGEQQLNLVSSSRGQASASAPLRAFPNDPPSTKSSDPSSALSGSVPTKSSLPSTDPFANSNKVNTAYVTHRSLSVSDGHLTAPSTQFSRDLSLQRYDSNLMLSEDSIAASRLDLASDTPFPEAILNHQGGFGEINLTVRYAVLRKRLIVMVNSCRNLFSCSEEGSDVYVRLYLLPEQSWKHRMRTPVKKKTVNPVFNEKFEFTVPHEEAKTRKLDVAVKNNGMFHRRERKDIGMVIIDLSQKELVKGFTDWFGLSLPGLQKIT